MHLNKNVRGGTVNYRGVEYQVVQTIGGGFRWSAQFGEQEKSGLLPRRDAATVHVKNLIDGRAERFSKPASAVTGQSGGDSSPVRLAIIL
jgi:hypothetical protein